MFPGTHTGVRGASVYADGSELTATVDDLTHGHFAEYDVGLSADERARQVVWSGPWLATGR